MLTNQKIFRLPSGEEVSAETKELAAIKLCKLLNIPTTNLTSGEQTIYNTLVEVIEPK